MPDIKHFDPDRALDSALLLFWRQGWSTTGVQQLVTVTGVNRSSLYATFGGKNRLYLAALRRYAERYSRPAFRQLAGTEAGLPAIDAFFDALIGIRCTGEYARWGCMIANAHIGVEEGDPEVRRLLDDNHRELRAALLAALLTAGDLGQLAPGTDPDATAELLALLAYGVNLRSRAGAGPEALRQSVATALAALGPRS